jgi:N-methylhydantoinase A/oxoprolinase/acetone carboxylase beta subunit
VSAAIADSGVKDELAAARQSLPDPIGEQSVFDPSLQKHVDARVYLRNQLAPGDCLAGPVLITESQTTTVVTSNFEARISEQGHIVMSRPGGVDHG